MNSTANTAIRAKIDDAGIRYWQVAAEVGVNRVTLCEWFRFPLTGERLERVEAAIERLTQKGGGSNE